MPISVYENITRNNAGDVVVARPTINLSIDNNPVGIRWRKEHRITRGVVRHYIYSASRGFAAAP